MPGNSKKSLVEKPNRQTLNTSGDSTASSGTITRARKRKRCELRKYSESDLESEFEDCNLNDAKEIEMKLRKVAQKNSLNDEEMRKLLTKFVKNEHVLALVTLKAEDELAREKKLAAEKGAMVIKKVPNVTKMTRAKAREFKCAPGLTLPPLNEVPVQAEIEALINEELHSDEEDEEYTFKEEDFLSDDDKSITTSDFDSNPCTPTTPYTAADDSPVKFSDDGCFKIPCDKLESIQEDLRIAARTRSKLCLQKTTIEDLQSELIAPDIEHIDLQPQEGTFNDEEWMQFLNDFSKPLSNSFIGDDDDPINDPEYVAAEKVPMDAEELRDVSISKKELNNLVSELFEGLGNEGVSLESIDLETSQRFLISNIVNDCETNEEASQQKSKEEAAREQATRQLDFNGAPSTVYANPESTLVADVEGTNQCCTIDSTVCANVTKFDYAFHPDVMSPPAPSVGDALIDIPIANASVSDSTDLNSPCKVSIPNSALSTDPQLIAVPVPGQPNCYQLAKVIANGDAMLNQIPMEDVTMPMQEVSSEYIKRYSIPYDNNFTWRYISVRKHIYSEYIEKFENLRNIKPMTLPTQYGTELTTQMGFTKEQHDMLQQQLRIHVQTLTQSFLQTYSHPKIYSMAEKPKKMIYELKERATKDASFNAWNLNDAVELIEKWEADLSSDEFKIENADMMDFIHQEIELTDSNTRQVARLPPRIMHLMLESTVFMYPQYLPRMAFSPKKAPNSMFSPAEYQLMAMGLEKHLTQIKKQRIHKSACPIRCACKRMAKDTIFGKTGRRIYEKVRELRDDTQYNPVKYYFENEHAPPVTHTLITFPNGMVRSPRECYDELPVVWKYFLDNNLWYKGRRPPLKSSKKVSAEACSSYLEFVREAVGEVISLPENLAEAIVPHESGATDLQINATIPEIPAETPSVQVQQQVKTLSPRSKRKIKRRPISRRPTLPKNLTITVNYVFGGAGFNKINNSGVGASIPLPTNYSSSIFETSVNECNVNNLSPVTQPQLPVDSDVPAINFSYDVETGKLNPGNQSLEKSVAKEPSKTQKSSIETAAAETSIEADETLTQNSKHLHKSFRVSTSKRRLRTSFFRATPKRSLRRRHIYSKTYCRRKQKRRCHKLIAQYRDYLQRLAARYMQCKPVQHYHIRFKALYLYTRLLRNLKMFCRSKVANAAPLTTTSLSQRRQRGTAAAASNEDDPSAASGRSRRGNRQEENFRHMLQPDSQEEIDRKDGIFAFNFYEKVEESLTAANRKEDFKKFSQLLKTFDPRTTSVADLYLKVEKLLLPDCPELAEVFLNFLLPSEAAQIGKFFEHFMITNATTFINKLNIYFNKQPAQIRKIYGCLSELAEKPNVTMKQVEAKILPLLRGNQFLIDWFMQQFPPAKPPERVLPTPETINLNEVRSNTTGEFMETVTQLLDSPSQEQQQQQQSACQVKYINGRIFYGSKMMLPAKLTFMAKSIYNEQNDDDDHQGVLTKTGCAHGVSVHGDKLIAAAIAAESALDCNSDDNDRSEEDDVSRALIIDTTCDEDYNSCSSIEICDETAHRAHAARLNPGCYSSFTTATAAATSTPNVTNTYQGHYPHTKKVSLNFNSTSAGIDECRNSPRKNSLSNSPMSGVMQLATPILVTPSTSAAAVSNSSSSVNTQNRVEKRKSPIKKNKSPISLHMKPTGTRPIISTGVRVSVQPMVVIHEQQTSSAIACAKRLKTLIDSSENNAQEEHLDTKANLNIIAQEKANNSNTNMETDADAAIPLITCVSAKRIMPTPPTHKTEATTGEEDLEFLSLSPVNSARSSPISLTHCPFPGIKMDADTSDGEDNGCAVVSSAMPMPIPTPPRQHVITTQFDSDEDCKLDVVASLASCSDSTAIKNSLSPPKPQQKRKEQQQQQKTPQTNSLPAAWTRDEDKIILIEMKSGASNREHLLQRIRSKLKHRTLSEITARHQFLMDFLSKLQGKL